MGHGICCNVRCFLALSTWRESRTGLHLGGLLSFWMIYMAVFWSTSTMRRRHDRNVWQRNECQVKLVFHCWRTLHRAERIWPIEKIAGGPVVWFIFVRSDVRLARLISSLSICWNRDFGPIRSRQDMDVYRAEVDINFFVTILFRSRLRRAVSDSWLADSLARFIPI